MAHKSEAGRVMVTLGPYLYKTAVPVNFPMSSPWLGGVGLLAEGGIDKNGGLEFGFFYLNHHYYRKEQSFILAEKVERVHITMGYRHWFSEEFSAALSFFSAYSAGNHKVIRSDGLPSGATSTSAQDATEYGFDASIIWEFWNDEESAVLIDGRYSHSVTKKFHEYPDHYGFLIGYKHSIEVR